ncbi:MAG: carboxysome shell protein [Chromatiaceae bacterium]|nr:MAG: carboxysome shell protein [Chromatiaceae bacterium]
MASKANLKSSGREAALARRQALSSQGKARLVSSSTASSSRSSSAQRVGSAQRVRPPRPTADTAAPPTTSHLTPLTLAPSVSLGNPTAARRPAAAAPRPAKAVPSPSQSSRALARQRRAALANSGRRALRSQDRVRTPAATTARAAAATKDTNRDCPCGRGCECQGQAATSTLTPAATSLAAAAPTNGNGRNGRNKRAEQALGTKPTGRMLSLARRRALSGRGKGATNTPHSIASLARQANPRLSGRELAQQVRSQRSSNGRAGERQAQPTGRMRPRAEQRLAGASDQPWKVGASETAIGQVVTGTRVGRSRRTTGDEPSTCRTITGTEYMGAEIFREFCQAEPPLGVPKVRVSPTGFGNLLTGNEVGRSPRVTGDEPGTCQQVTGTQYLSPDQFAAWCETRPEPGPSKIGISGTRAGRPVSGNQVGRSSKVTGDEPGTCQQVTGTQYLSPDQSAAWCESRAGTWSVAGSAAGSAAGTAAGVRTQANPDRSPKRGSQGPSLSPNPRQQPGRQQTSATPSMPVPPKVGTSVTLSGGVVTGTRVGRSQRVTGNEPGSCRLVTGDEYVDLGQYQQFCQTQPQPEPPKVGHSHTHKRKVVSGTQTGRSSRVTGDEPGTCKAITGTPYAGLEQAETWCEPEQQQAIQARTRQLSATPGPRMTGIQPGIDPAPARIPPGQTALSRLSGAGKGACEPITGTPYVGADQYVAACGPEEATAGNGAHPGDTDFPQLLDTPAGDDDAPWQQFSVSTPAREAFAAAAARSPVTGTNYETGGQYITGPFGMATGKITGTEQARFDGRHPRPSLLSPNPMAAPHQGADGGLAAAAHDPGPPDAVSRRITGEGQTAGRKVTGDDWERGNNVTGTEGASARRRNPTRPGPMSVMPPVERKRNEDVAPPTSRVTGSAGSTERGSLITYSGGARG